MPPALIACCPTPELFLEAVHSTPVAVVQIRALALESMFDEDYRAVVTSLPYDVLCVVAPPEAVRTLAAAPPMVGDVLVLTRGRLVGRIRPGAPGSGAGHPADRLLGLLRAGLSPWLSKAGAPQWDDDESDPFAVIGVPASASYEEVHAAWRRRLTEYHPDLFARAGEKIRRVAEAESQRINVAFRAIEKKFRL